MTTVLVRHGLTARFAIASAKSHDVLLVDEALATGDAEFRVQEPRAGSRSCASRQARSSWSRTTWTRSRRPATG